MRGRLLSVAQLTPDDERAWNDLAGRAVEPNPFLEPACLVPAAIHQTYGSEIQLAVAEEGGRFYACVPLRSVRSWNRFHYPIITSQVRRMTYLGTPLVDAARGVEAVGSILATLQEERRLLRSRVLALQWMHEDGPAASIVESAVRAENLDLFVLESFERGLLSRRSEPTYDELLSTGDRKRRRRRRRRLAEHLGAEPHLVVRTLDATAIDEYISLEASGYKGRSGAAMATVPGEIDYFRDMCQRFITAGRLHVLALQVDQQTLAMKVLVRGAEGLFGAKTSYDERFACYSPGVELQLSAMTYFHEATDASWLDTCTFQKNELLLRLYPERRRITSWLVNLGGPADVGAIRAFFVAKAVHKRIWDLSQQQRAGASGGHQTAGAAR
jgi:CelD/BcsL family acetyltransferase involved in cellulose biosynthesis